MIRILKFMLVALAIASLGFAQTSATKAPPAVKSAPPAKPGAQAKTPAASSPRPVRGILSAQMGYSGTGADGTVTIGAPVKILTTSEGHFELRSTPQTKYYGIKVEDGNRIWDLGGEYEAVGTRAPGSRSKIDGVKYTLQLISIRLLNANPKSEESTTATANGPKTAQGKIMKIEAGSGKVLMDRDSGGALPFWTNASTAWSGVKGLSDVLPDDKVIVEYTVRTRDGTATHIADPEVESRMLDGPMLKAVASAVVVDISRPDRPVVREGIMTETFSVVVDGNFVPGFKVKEFPDLTFVCDQKQASEWKLFALDSSEVVVGKSPGQHGRVRLLTKKLKEGYEQTLDFKRLE